MFKFSFPNPDGDDSLEDKESHCLEPQEDLSWLPSKKVKILPSHLTSMLSHQDFVSHYNIGNLTIPHLSTETVLKSVMKKSEVGGGVKLAEELHSDLVPSKYEGGLKIWECTDDLLKWLLSTNPDANLKGKNVMDLGCGAGLLGIAALKCGANVVFQDYNEEVLDSYTILNVLLNITDEESQKLIEDKSQKVAHCEFFSGDWLSLPDKLQEGRTEDLKFDIILTSETIYNPNNFQKLCNIFQKCLKPSGCVFLAAKTYYFGVGGSLRDFEDSLQKTGSFQSEVCWKCDSGVSREILKITFVN